VRKSFKAGTGVLVLVAAGFASASILAGGGLGAVLRSLTGTTETETHVTTGTTTVPGGRRVVVCKATESRKHPFRTIVVDQHAVASVLKHGGHIGACTGSETPTRRGHHGEHHPTSSSRGATTTTVGDTQDESSHSSPSTSGHGNSSEHGDGADDGTGAVRGSGAHGK
jgi:hypothetical protein